MCFSFSKVYQSSRWNWDGDRIVHESIIPSSRPPVGHNGGNYDIDVREFRGLLPHHNEIAVDEDTRDKKHILYSDNKVYAEQYRLRYDAAAKHIGEAFKKHWKPEP